ncbi:MAG: hypothetical protein ACOCVZ_08195 [Gemmatimonadota bacterium]
MLTLEPRAWYSWDFRVMDGGREVAFLDRRVLREQASFALSGDRYTARRTSLARGTFVLEGPTGVLARATKTGIFRREFEVEAGPERWLLRAVSPLTREFQLLRDGVLLGTVQPVAILRRRARLDLSDAVPAPLQVFVAFLVLVLWKRAADAAVGGS